MAEEYVEMTGTGVASGAPDVALLRLRIEHGAAGVAAALEGCAQATEAVIAALDDGGVAGTDRQTSSLRVDNRWNQQTGQPDGFTAQQGLQVRVHDSSTVGQLIEACATAAGDAFRLDELRWDVSNPTPLEHNARENAWLDAYAKARQAATLAGRELGPVIQVVESEPMGPQPRLGFAKMAAMDVGSMPVESGEHQVEVTLLVRWAFDRH